MLFNGRALIFTFSRTQVRIAEIERLQSLFKTSMPTSNGFAERTVQIIKRLMKKAKQGKTDPYLGLLDLRNIPVHGLASPVQLSMSRRLRSLIPCAQKHLRPAVVEHRIVEDMLKRKQATQKQRYDKSAKDLVNNERTRVRVMNVKPRWKPAVVLQTPQHATPRSYIVQTERETYRRNRRRASRANSIHYLISTNKSKDYTTGKLLPTSRVPPTRRRQLHLQRRGLTRNVGRPRTTPPHRAPTEVGQAESTDPGVSLTYNNTAFLVVVVVCSFFYLCYCSFARYFFVYEKGDVVI